MAELSGLAKAHLQRRQLGRRALLEHKQAGGVSRQINRSLMRPHDFKQGFRKHKQLAFSQVDLPKQYKIRRKRHKLSTPGALASGRKGAISSFGAGGGGTAYRQHKKPRGAQWWARPGHEKVQTFKLLQGRAGVEEVGSSGKWSTSGYIRPRDAGAPLSREREGLLAAKLKTRRKTSARRFGGFGFDPRATGPSRKRSGRKLAWARPKAQRAGPRGQVEKIVGEEYFNPRGEVL